MSKFLYKGCGVSVSEVVLAVIGMSVTVIGMLGGALYWLGKKFE
ncbi:MAG: hypothetical protein QXW40_05405 [Thermofilum sp.]